MIAEQFRALLERANTTPTKFALELDIHRSTIHKWMQAGAEAPLWAVKYLKQKIAIRMLTDRVREISHGQPESTDLG